MSAHGHTKEDEHETKDERRTNMRRRGWRLIYFVVVLLSIGNAGLIAGEVPLGAWVPGWLIETPSEIDAVIQTAVELGIDTLYVQIVGLAVALYNSRILPRSERLLRELAAAGINRDFDPFEYILNRAAEHGLRVVPWVNTFPVWRREGPKPIDPIHVVNAHPEWITYHISGVRVIGEETANLPGIKIPRLVWLDPGLEEVRNFFADIAEEILTMYGHHGIDEIHLDYCLYGHRTFGFHPRVLAEYRIWVRRMLREGKLADIPSPFDEFRILQVNETVRTINTRIKAVNPNARLSAAVFSFHVAAVEHQLQAWDRWINEGIIDYVVLMTYITSLPVIDYEVRQALQLTHGRGVKIGLGAYKFHGKAELFAEAIATVLAHKDVRELVFFSIESLMDDPALREAVRDAVQTYRETRD